MRILVLGGTGLLGHALRAGDGDRTVTLLGSRDCDVRNLEQVRAAVSRAHPDWVFNAAAYTDVDACESNESLAFDVNAYGAGNVARSARESGCRMLHVSSDYVFDGLGARPYQPEDPVRPQSAYGRSKAAGETAVRCELPDACIVRASWLFGVGGKCFPETILRAAQSRPELRVVNDQRGCPTHTFDLARALYALARQDAAGTFHACNRGECTWYEFACEVLRQAGITATILPCSSQDYPRPAPRPRYSVLSDRGLRAYGIAMPPWQEAVADFLRQRRSAAVAAQREAA